MNEILSPSRKYPFTMTTLLVLSLLSLLIGSCVKVRIHVLAVSSGIDGNQSVQMCELEEKSLDIFKYPQETSDWCWAASAQTVMNYHLRNAATTNDPEDTEQEPLGQCVIAGKALGHSDICCTTDMKPSTASECRRGYRPERALRKFGFEYSEPEKNPGFEYLWAQLTNQICAGQPVIFEEHFLEGGGHSNVIYGYGKDDLTGRWVELYDHQFVTDNLSSDLPSAEPTPAPDFQQVNFEYDLFFEPDRDDPIRKSVWYIFDIQPF